MGVTIGEDSVRLLELVDLFLEAVEALLVLKSPLSLLLNPIVSVHELVVARLEFMVALQHLVQLLIQSLIVCLHACQFLHSPLTFIHLLLHLCLVLSFNLNDLLL